MMSKNQMIEELQEYHNLVRAMAALFYISKLMGEVIPCVFQNWKEFAFETKAKKIRNLVTNEKKSAFEMSGLINGGGGIRPAVFDNKDFSHRMILKGLSSAAEGGEALGSQGLTINYDSDTLNRLRGMDEEEILDHENAQNGQDGCLEELDFLGD